MKGLATALFAFVAAAIVTAWAWLGAPVQMPASPLEPEKHGGISGP